MRRLMISSVTVFGLWLLGANAAEQNDLDDQLSVFPGRSVLGSLPSGGVIGASLIRGDKWYVLSASEILAVRSLLKQERFVPPKEMTFIQLPPRMNRLVLWGVAKGKPVALHVLAMDDSVTILSPCGKDTPGWYAVRDGEQRACLQRLMKRIQAGKQQPVVQAERGSTGPDTSTTAECPWPRFTPIREPVPGAPEWHCRLFSTPRTDSRSRSATSGEASRGSTTPARPAIRWPSTRTWAPAPSWSRTTWSRT
jgi:hypothetical protein